MIFRVIALSLLAALGAYAWMQLRSAPAIAVAGIASALAGAHFILFPDHATVVAGWLGIGRGADLVLYLWLLLSLVLLMNLHVRLRSMQVRMTRLAREIALMKASATEGSSPPAPRPAQGGRDPGTPGEAD